MSEKESVAHILNELEQWVGKHPFPDSLLLEFNGTDFTPRGILGSVKDRGSYHGRALLKLIEEIGGVDNFIDEMNKE